MRETFLQALAETLFGHYGATSILSLMTAGTL